MSNPQQPTMVKKVIRTITRPRLSARRPKAGKVVVKTTTRPRPKASRAVARIPRPMSVAGSHPKVVEAAAKYVAGLCNGVAIPDCNLPVDGKPFPFRELTAKWRVYLQAGTTGQSWMIFNPDLMWCNTGLRYNNTYNSSAFLAPMYLSLDGTLGPTQAVGASNSVGTIDNSSNQYAGDVKFVGGSLTFSNYANVETTGGLLFHFHNPQGRSLLTSQVDPTAGTVNIFGTTNGAGVIAAQDMTSISTVGTQPLKIVILPHNTEFETMTTDVTLLTANPVAADVASSQVALENYVPCSFGEVAHRGWTQAIAYLPTATYSSGAATNVVVDFTMHYHLNVAPSNGTAANVLWANPAGTAVTQTTRVDPRVNAAVSSAISSLKLARSQDSSVGIQQVGAPHPPSVIQSIMSTVGDIFSPIAQIAGTFLGSRATGLVGGLASMLTSGMSRYQAPAAMEYRAPSQRRITNSEYV